VPTTSTGLYATRSCRGGHPGFDPSMPPTSEAAELSESKVGCVLPCRGCVLVRRGRRTEPRCVVPSQRARTRLDDDGVRAVRLTAPTRPMHARSHLVHAFPSTEDVRLCRWTARRWAVTAAGGRTAHHPLLQPQLQGTKLSSILMIRVGWFEMRSVQTADHRGRRPP
jgi:hypothetical protein